MKAVVVAEHGGLDKLVVRDLDPPKPAAGEVLIRVKAASVNHLDLWVRRGIAGVRYPLPLVLGCDGAGVVAEAGAGVDDLAPGTRVVLQPGVSCGHCAACLAGDDPLCRFYGILGEHRNGTQAELVSVPRANVLPIGESLDFETAAAFPLTFLTAWHMAVARAGIQPGDDVLVHAGASGVGSAAIQIAHMLGARVITTVGSAAKAQGVRDIGADHVILYREDNFAERVRELTGRRGVDVILDHLGLDTWEANTRCLTRGGRLVVCGATTGHEVPTNLRFLFFKNLAFLGSTMGSKAELVRILALVERGTLRPVVDRVLALEDVARAHERLEARRVVGKIVLRIDG